MKRIWLISVCVLVFLAAGRVTAQTAAGSAPSDKDLSGEWSVTVLSTNWKVFLSRSKVGNEPTYSGEATRKGGDGKDVTLYMTLARTDKNELILVSIKDGLTTICKAPFTATGKFSGTCEVLGDNVRSGAFVATRVSPEQSAPPLCQRD